ncbi:MAG: OmpA family protein, partial [Saprospiraceae bacterium]|nr:OmpA family protein [Saprospiraceae bacterium]
LVVSRINLFLKEDRIKPDIKAKAEKYLRDAEFLKSSVPEYATTIERLPATINTDAMEYLPSFPAREDIMIFTRRVRGQEDFFWSKMVNGEWQESRAIAELNTSENEGAHCLSADGKMLVFTACNRKDGLGSCDLYYALFDGQKWSAPANLGPDVNTRYWDGQPSLSANGRTLYFSSERPGGKGGRDLWKIDRKGGGWSQAVNLSSLNTPGNEEVPFVHAADESLYFMSDGLPGCGGSDLFISRKVDNEWQAPKNLGRPINTSEDEGALHVNLAGTKAYFARSVFEGNNRPQIDIFSFDLPQPLRPAPATYVSIRILDKNTKQPLQAIVELINLSSSKVFTKILSDKKGEVLVCIPANEEYAANVSKTGYVFYSEHIQVLDLSTLIDPFEFDVLLSPTKEEVETIPEPIVLNNVFFATGSAALLDKSTYELNKLVGLLNESPDMKIQIRGHTDDVGNDDDNQILSEARAKAIYNYLLDKGIKAEQMTYVGFGENIPIADNQTPEGRQKNRRTEFLIMKNDKE